jgi:hypothetical protein
MSAPEPCLVLDGSARAGVRVGVLSGGRWVGQGLSPDGALEGLFGCVEVALAEAKLKLSDIVVVTPFNMQVALLKRALPEGARVGTVDKFQGQEAPVVIVSMATSFGGDAPRGTAFLFNRNRLNVAFSRAQCLAILVRGKSLLELPQPDKEDLTRLDLLARYEALSSTDAAAEDGEKH